MAVLKCKMCGGALEIQQGELFSLLGVNGAGKTTLMRMICGILKPTSGTVALDNKDVGTEEYRDILGYLPQDFGFYPEFSGKDFLLYMSAVKGLTKKDAVQKTKELIELVGLGDSAGKKVRTYSGGMRQRLGIAQALLNDPQILIMDEPTAGLDPQERIRFRELISELGQNKIVLLSTHIVKCLKHKKCHTPSICLIATCFAYCNKLNLAMRF